MNPSEFRIDGPAPIKGQQVSMTSSLVTVTHIPSGTSATVDLSSQHMNRNIALEMIEWALTYDTRPKTFGGDA